MSVTVTFTVENRWTQKLYQTGSDLKGEFSDHKRTYC